MEPVEGLADSVVDSVVVGSAVGAMVVEVEVAGDSAREEPPSS